MLTWRSFALSTLMSWWMASTAALSLWAVVSGIKAEEAGVTSKRENDVRQIEGTVTGTAPSFQAGRPRFERGRA